MMFLEKLNYYILKGDGYEPYSTLLKREMNENIILATTLYKHNFSEVDNLVQFAIKNNIKKIIFTLIHKKEQAKEKWSDLMNPLTVRAQMVNYISKLSHRLDGQLEVIICGDVFTSEEMFVIGKTPLNISCNEITKEIQIDSKSQVTLCQFFSALASCTSQNCNGIIPFENFVWFLKSHQPISLYMPSFSKCKNCYSIARCGAKCIRELAEDGITSK